jgi:tetratricopeptide (TPR) repeat protein
MSTKTSLSLHSENRPLSLAPDISDRLQAVEITPEQGFILSRIDGRLTPREILAVTPLDEQQTVLALTGLIASGLVLFNGAAQNDASLDSADRSQKHVDLARREKLAEIERHHRECEKMTPTELLGISTDAGMDEIKRAFRQKVLHFHPDRYHEIDDPVFRQKLSHLVAVTTDAFNTLSERLASKKRASTGAPPLTMKRDGELDGYDARHHALELYQHAQRAYDTQDFWQTIQLCRQAIEVKDDQPEYHFLLARALLKNKKWRKEAGESLRKAAELDPCNPDYLGHLAALYQREGLQMRAKKLLEQVKGIDPDYEIPELPA